MGTSKSDPGPTGGMPLLPPWAPELPPLPDGFDEPEAPADVTFDGTPAWTMPRKAITRLAKSARRGAAGRRDVGRAVGGVVRALGGARGATRRAVAGRSTASRLAAFFSAAVAGGAARAASLFRLDAFLGGSVESFLDALLDALAPDGGLTEDAVARAAAADTVDNLFDELGIVEGGLEALDRLTPDVIATALRRFIANYAIRRALQALSSRIEQAALSPERGVEVERMVRAFVQDTVDFDLRGRDPATVDWDGAEGHVLVARVFEDAFALLEAALE